MTVTWPTTTAIPPSQQSQVTRGARLLQCQFGDGYEQTAPDGINAVTEEWQLDYPNLDAATRTTLKAACDAAILGDFITWTAPGDSVAKIWKMDKSGYTETCLSGSIYAISLKLRRVY